MAEAGAIPPLVSMLGSPNPQMQANAAAALAAMTGVTAGSPHHENQSAVARTGAIAPLCALVREGVEEVKEQSASALWALSDSNLANKATTSKLGGIEPLVALVVSAHNESALSNAQGALISLSAKHAENRGAIAKLLVKLVAKLQTAPAGAKNILLTVSLFADDGPANQVALATAGAIPQLILKLSDGSDSKGENDAAHCEAAHALLSMATGNATVQTLITRVGGVPPLIELVAKGNMDAQKHAARALWHLATDNQAASSISSSGGIPPLVAMLSLGDLQGKETAAATISRLSRVSPSVALSVANEGGVAPLIRLLTHGSQAAQQQAAAAIADVGSVPATRDVIAEAGGVAALVGLLKSIAHGTAETAARALANLARDGGGSGSGESSGTTTFEATVREDSGEGRARRLLIAEAGGIAQLIQLLYSHSDPTMGGVDTYRLMSPQGTRAAGMAPASASPAAASEPPSAAKQARPSLWVRCTPVSTPQPTLDFRATAMAAALPASALLDGLRPRMPRLLTVRSIPGYATPPLHSLPQPRSEGRRSKSPLLWADHQEGRGPPRAWARSTWVWHAWRRSHSLLWHLVMNACRWRSFVRGGCLHCCTC